MAILYTRETEPPLKIGGKMKDRPCYNCKFSVKRQDDFYCKKLYIYSFNLYKNYRCFYREYSNILVESQIINN